MGLIRPDPRRPIVFAPSFFQRQAHAAAALVAAHWRSGTRMDRLPDDLVPANRDQGHAIQAALASRIGEEEVVGWKIAATSPAGQAHIGVDEPIPGRIFADRCHADGVRLAFGHNAMRVVEAEFAFALGADLTPRHAQYEPETVMAAVDRLHLALEIPDSRFIDFAAVGGPSLIADNACAHEFVLGPEAPAVWRDLDLAGHRVTLWVNDLRHRGVGANVLGGPVTALTWLVNALSAIGEPLLAGQIVTTGTCIVPAPIAPGDRIRADFGVLGRMSMSFERA